MSNESFIRGRQRIAKRIGRSEKTVSRWISLGILSARKTGPHPNNALEANVEHLERLRQRFGTGQEDE